MDKYILAFAIGIVLGSVIGYGIGYAELQPLIHNAEDQIILQNRHIDNIGLLVQQ